MKIIILTGKFGMGHMTAAMAIKQHIDNSNMNANAELIDWLDYISPKLADKYYTFFHFIVSKGNKLYNARYRFLENRKTDQKPELSQFFQKHFSKLMEEKKPDLIISTIPICSQLMSRYKVETGSPVPLITCVTDITGHSEWINRNTDFYFVGSRTVARKFISKGVLPCKIIVTGLPVRLEFQNNIPCDKIYKSHNHKNILVMGGGLGMLPKALDFYDGLNKLPNVEITVITGKNRALFQRLNGRFNRIRVLGYVQNICEYMSRADMIITKPGGVTIFEAIYSEVPILALKPSLQQELYNARFIQEMGIGTILQGKNIHCYERVEAMLDFQELDMYKKNVHTLKEHLYSNNLTRLLELILYEGRSPGKPEYLYNPVSEGYSLNEKISFNL